MIDLAAALRLVVDALDAVDAKYVVVGSTAAAAWGAVRATRDIDIVTLVEDDVADRFTAQLDRDDLYLPVDDAGRALREGGSFNVLHPRTGGKVDVFVSQPGDDFTRSRLRRRVRADVLGVPTWVATAEDVVLAKLRWRLESRSEVQWRDCVEIVATQPLDHRYLWSWADRLEVVEDLAELLGDD